MTSVVYLAKVSVVTAATRLNLTRLIFTSIFIAVGLILIHPVFAQDATSSTTRKENIQQKVPIRPYVESKKEMLQWEKAAVKEKIATREAALKAKLEKFKDKKKAEITQRVNTNLNRINQNQTTQMLKHLEKMSGILDKLEARVNQATKATIALARSKIASSTAAVSDQAKKDYTLTINSESKVKSDIQAVRNQLHTDLQAVRKSVIEAKQAVGSAITVAKGGKEATSSGQQ